MKKVSIFIISSLFIFFLNFKCKRENIETYPLSPFEKTDTLNQIIVQKDKYFIIYNYDTNDSSQISYVKKFAIQQLDLGYENFSSFNIIFYKQSANLKLNFRQTESDILLWHGNDIVFTFQWLNGKFGFYNDYVNGRITKTVYSLKE